MNASRITLAVATALLSGTALEVQAGVDEPSPVISPARSARIGTDLDDDTVRPLDRSRKPMPAIEQDVVLPEPRHPRRSRDADDEVVLPGTSTFRPERSLDDSFVLPEKPAKRAEPRKRSPHVERGKHVAEDPAERANESGRPSREGRVEQ